MAYALPKLDLVAIPDFSAGAMENWGLITYRQVALEVSPTSSLDDRRYVSIIVAHELAHQWFGNLVTMSWWNDLWSERRVLRPTWSTWVRMRPNPEMSLLEDFYSDIVPVALEYDAKRFFSCAVHNAATVSSSSSIEGVFDAIEYQKGGAVLRMVRAWMNRDAISKDGEGWETSRTHENDPFLSGPSTIPRRP